MSDYLTRLVERSLGVGAVAHPRLASLFEPHGTVEAPAPPVEGWAEAVVGQPAPVPVQPPAPPREPDPAPRASSERQEQESSPEARRPGPQHAVVVEHVSWVEPATPATPATPAPEDETPLSAPSPEVKPRERSDRGRPAPAAPRTTIVVRERERAVSAHQPAPERVSGSEPRSRPESRPEPVAAPRPASAPASLRQAAAEEPPVVRVTIGRVDVRAVLPDPPAQRSAPRRAPRLTLEDYLRQAGKP